MNYELNNYKSFFNLDRKLMKLGVGEIPPEIYTTTMNVPDPLVRRIIHTDKDVMDYNLQEGKTTTILIPPWGFEEKMHSVLIKYAQMNGPVIEFLWKREAISADVHTTAKSYHGMQAYLVNTFEQIENMKNRYDVQNIDVIAGSAGVPIFTEAIKLLADENKKSYNLINDVTLVGMADNFADCYTKGARTKYLAKLKEEEGYDMNNLYELFKHMAPINAIPALNNVKGKVTWITSFSDEHFPLENQIKVMDEIKRTGSKIDVKIVPELGHIGSAAVYYAGAIGLTQNKTFLSLVDGLTEGKLDKTNYKLLDKADTLMNDMFAYNLDVPDEWLDLYMV
ncbi:MAG: hypothetical protein KJ583_07560, partial [Nanoarchaeota archaeon]|nr:hypothetical protein [Nanoarchaeota archaeon]MBU1605144.1 hypothetical protein [Nanoarchaeota archaeon]MBU2442959.1 hypothetical protein [Nanoarchaeota archaeon]